MDESVKQGLLALALLAPVYATAQTVSAAPPALPAHLAQCKINPALSSSDGASYDNCVAYDTSDYYGRAYIQFHMPAFSSDQFAAAMTKAQKRSLLKRVGDFFAPSTNEGSLVATFILQRQGLPDTIIGIVELARFQRTSSKGITINQSGETLNGFYGPIFRADSTTHLRVKLDYIFNRKQFSNVSTYIKEASTLLSGQGFLGSKVSISEPALKALSAVEQAITGSFSTSGVYNNPVQLSFDPGSTMAVHRSVTFKGVIGQPAHLFLGAVRLRSVLVDTPPGPSGPLVYSGGGFGLLATVPITNRMVQGGTLRDYVRTHMEGSYEDLAKSDDQQNFLKATDALRSVLTASTLQLVANDQLAAQWAFVAGNPLMQRADVRKKYALASSEASGDLAVLNLDLPKVAAPPLTEAQQSLMAAALGAGALADNAELQALNATNSAKQASSQADLPSSPVGYVRVAMWPFQYRGAQMKVGAPVKGVLVELIAGRKNNRFEGSLALSGTTPIFEGSGRYTNDPANAAMGFSDYTGQFVANWFNGHGVMRWPDNSSFRGTFAQDKPNGYGLYTRSDGSIYYTRFDEGAPVGPAILRQPNGDMVAGSWSAGQFIPAQ